MAMDSIKEYRDIMYRVSSRLTKDECQDIALLYNLHNKYQDERQFIIFIQLEKEQIISENCPDNLVNVLKRVNRLDLANDAKKWSAALKKNKKKPPSLKDHKKTTTAPPTPTADTPTNWTSVEFALARKQVDQLATTLNNIRSNQCCDQEITNALEKLSLVNTHLSKAEQQRGLPTTKRFNDAFEDDLSSSSCQSSISSNISQEEILYEPMNYGRPQAETGHVASPPEKVRLPLPAPKPPKKLPPTKPTVTSSSSNSEPLPKKIISPRQSTEAGTILLTPQMGRVPLPGLVRTSPRPNTTCSPGTEFNQHYKEYDDTTGGSGDTGDSGRGTGSDYGFSDVRPFLRQSPSKTQNVHPAVPPKPIRYTSLSRNTDASGSEYTSLRPNDTTTSHTNNGNKLYGYYSTRR